MKIQYAFFSFLLVTCLWANPTKNRYGDPQIYILNKDKVAIYETMEDESSKQTSSFQLGELFFGVKKKNGWIQMGKYSHFDRKFTNIVGWVKEQDVITNQESLTVSKAVQTFDIGTRDPLASSKQFSLKNELPLRVISKPETRITPTSIPGGKGRKFQEKYSFTWYYVYDIAKIEGEIYYLISHTHNLFTDSFILETKSSYNKEAKKNLLGWIPRTKVEEWCSNVTFEYNTELKALKERYQSKKSASMFANPKESTPVAQEPFVLWNPYFSKKARNLPVDITKLRAQPDPIGLDPDIPRFHVMEALDRGWYKVTTLGSLKPEISEGEISQLILQLRAITRMLRAIDLVFVVDATGSMIFEIDEIRKFLKEFCQYLAKLQSGRQITVKLPGSNRLIQMETSVDIRASLVLYQQLNAKNDAVPFQTKTVFRSLPLATHWGTIKKELDKITPKILKGSSECLHVALKEALDDPQLWRGDYSLRTMILIADEPGEVGEITKKTIYNSLPHPAKRLQRLGFNPTNLSKTDYTKLWAIYTNKEKFQQFRKNIDILTTPDRILSIPDFSYKKSASQLLIKVIYESIKKASEEVSRRIEQLAKELYMRRRGTKSERELAASVILDKVAIDAACQRMGISLDDLSKITNVAFVKGYIKEKYSFHNHKAFRPRVVVSHEDLELLQNQVFRFATELGKVLKSKKLPIWNRRKPKMLLAATLLLSVANVAGEGSIYDNPRLLERHASLLIKKQGKIKSLARLLQFKPSLPISGNGILGQPLDKVLNMKRDELIKVTNNLMRRAKCLRNILNGESTPEYASEFSGHSPIAKNWIYKHPVSGTVFYYVPFDFIP